MNIQEKLDLFAQKALDSVNRKRRETALEVQGAVKAAVQKAEDNARHAMKKRLKDEAYKLEQEAHKRIYHAAIEARRELAVLRERLADELFADLEKDLRDFVTTEAYQDFLQEGIETAKQQFSGEVEIVQGDEIGGFRLISHDKRAVADYTLRTRLKELKDEGIWDKWPGIDGNR